MNTQNTPHNLPDSLRRLISAALDADIPPGRIEDLIRTEGRPSPGHCPECDSTMRPEHGSSLRCTNCGVTAAIEPSR